MVFLENRLRHIDDIVAHALKLGHDIHVIHAGLVVVAGTFDVVDVLFAQTVAAGVDFMLGFQGVVNVVPLLVLLHLQQDIAEQQQGEGEIGHVERETEHGQNPCGDGGADVGAHDDTDGLAQFQEAGVYEADHHDRGGRRALDERGDADTGQDLCEWVGGHGGKDAPHAVAGHFLESVGEETEAEKE